MVKQVNYFTHFQLLYTLIFLLAYIYKITCANKNTHEISKPFLSYFQYNHFVGSSSTSTCPEDGRSFIIGARLRTSNFLNQSYPTVTAMEFLCSDAITTSSQATGALLFQKNIGDWSHMSICPNGAFVSGITFYMQLVTNENLMHEDQSSKGNSTEQREFGDFDIFDLGKSCYVSGLSLNCSWNIEHKNDYDGLTEDGNIMKLPVIPPWRDKVTLGKHSRTGLRLYCTDGRAMSAVSLEQEALVTYQDGERWVPMKVTTRCTLITNPVTHCYPELDWEKIENISCSDDLSTGENVNIFKNVTCHVPHFVGISANRNIENLKTILRAYQPMNLEGRETREYLRSKLFTKQFIQDWENKYKLNISDYRRFIENRGIFTYLEWKREDKRVNFLNVNYNEPEYCKLIRKNSEEPFKVEFNVEQLVGFCSIYKIYFPLFKIKFYKYFERRIDGIWTRIIFPDAKDIKNVDEILNRKN